MQRRDLKAERNIGLVATVSARALKVAGRRLVWSHHDGINPQRMGAAVRALPSARIVRTSVVGAIL